MRLGIEPKGLIASGEVITEPYEASHWDSEKANQGKKALFVDVIIDKFVSEEDEVFIPQSILDQKPYSGVNWTPQSGGIEIDPLVAVELEDLWSRSHSSGVYFFPEELELSELFVEGTVRKVYTNRYERDRKARQACIDHFGLSCRVCGFNFEDKYGAIGIDYIHVHHIRPISTISTSYTLNPKEDLIPVCPNCHAMIHKKTPPYTIAEIKSRLYS